VDFFEFAPDGRIARLTGFYEPQETVAAEAKA
jgi:hypothetical protein